jgi:uncharacterized protein (TIGR02186 family)
MKRFVLLLALAFALPPAAAEEQLVVGLTEDAIHITSNFDGAEFVVYGTVETPDAFKGASERDIVIVVRGPNRTETVRKRERVAGVWVNADAVTFTDVPSFYVVASTAPLDRVTAPAVLKRKNIGLAYMTWGGSEAKDAAEFRKAVIRNRTAAGLYVEDSGAVQMNGPSLFQTRIVLPANVPVGAYTVDAYLFRNGQELSAYSAPLVIEKLGIERTLFEFAHFYGPLYGIATILLGMMIGLGGAFVFRERD